MLGKIDFSEEKVGDYSFQQIKETWPGTAGSVGVDEGRCEIVKDDSGQQCLRIKCLKGWVNGIAALERQIRFRDEGSRFGIDTVMFSVFFGGNTAEWAPLKDSYILFDEVCISDKDIP